MNLRDIEPALRDRVLTGARRRRLATGDLLYTPDDRAETVCFVSAGRMKIVRTAANGDELIIGIRETGDMFGEFSPFDDGVRRSSAVALVASEVDEISAREFERLLLHETPLARAFARGAARRLSDAILDLTEIAGKSVTGRLVDALGRLARRSGEPQPDGTIRIALELTHRDLADLIGTSRETLTKELGLLADVGLLRVGHKTITLVQPRAFPYAVPSDVRPAGGAR